MEYKNFREELERMCDCFIKRGCTGCPARKLNCTPLFHDRRTEKAVEKWAAEHPEAEEGKKNDGV